MILNIKTKFPEYLRITSYQHKHLKQAIETPPSLRKLSRVVYWIKINMFY